MENDKTTTFDLTVLKQELIMMNLNEVLSSLEKNGYNATNQLIGYIITNDLSYITNKDDARRKLSNFTREEILMTIINGYLGK